ncbi:hypothetical protein HYZ05_01420 [Candidatus Daviesbacteria bacterium]|nr:hypothetical protein [Candidatus Daviesbacteria bacterium]
MTVASQERECIGLLESQATEGFYLNPILKYQPDRLTEVMQRWDVLRRITAREFPAEKFVQYIKLVAEAAQGLLGAYTLDLESYKKFNSQAGWAASATIRLIHTIDPRVSVLVAAENHAQAEIAIAECGADGVIVNHDDELSIREFYDRPNIGVFLRPPEYDRDGRLPHSWHSILSNFRGFMPDNFGIAAEGLRLLHIQAARAALGSDKYLLSPDLPLGWKGYYQLEQLLPLVFNPGQRGFICSSGIIFPEGREGELQQDAIRGTVLGLNKYLAVE